MDGGAATVTPVPRLEAVCDRERVRNTEDPFLVEDVRDVAVADILLAPPSEDVVVRVARRKITQRHYNKHSP